MGILNLIFPLHVPVETWPLASKTREFPALGTFSVRGTFNNFAYEALQTRYARRLAKGLQFETNYTWGHSIDDLFGYGGQDNPGVTPQSNSRAMQRGSSGFDRRHDFHAFAYYDLPLGSSWMARRWNVGSIVRMASGTPYTPVTGTSIGDGSHVQRPNLLCANASTVVNLDFTITKNTRISERLTHQFRAEFYNAFNNTNFNTPNTSINDPNFGKITGPLPDARCSLQ